MQNATTNGPLPTERPSLRDRQRAAVRAEVTDVALRLFAQQGFDQTPVDQIAAEAGLSRATLFRHFGTKEDIVLGDLKDRVHEIADVLASRPENETPWEALRHTFRVITGAWDKAPQQALDYLRMIRETPSLRARYWEKQLSWHEALLPETARRLNLDADDLADPQPDALVGSALACLDAAAATWVACEAAVPSSLLLDRAMAALTVQA
ncbi:AcrR family transcriptional regulator [Streptomyces sp. SAI-133]|uniref:TetR/AcrR family transcriptional regulator n=1 Tax=unclassified Streptomyces TaxID=2593676 RepID=UPI0024760C17|nr:TetR/AcrR family transcriptional regulator [Streptomyces sp. SAI-133]MDH6590012.1 AcrR family transcriptional regulator [Streptomyces sp. SAI-133]